MSAVKPQELASAAGLMNFLRSMAGAIGASIAVTIWDDHTKLARSEMVGSLHTEDAKAALQQQGMSSEAIQGYISSLVDKEALTLSANHVFLLLSFIFITAALIIWLCPRPKTGAGGGHAH